MSWTIGVFVDLLVRRTSLYQTISKLRCFRRDETYKSLGVPQFGRLIHKWKLTFNPGLKSIDDWSLDSVKKMRDAMAEAEFCHWTGFAIMLVLTGLAIFRDRSVWLVLAFVLSNVFGNLYLCLLQQYNKSRLDSIIAIASE